MTGPIIGNIGASIVVLGALGFVARARGDRSPRKRPERRVRAESPRGWLRIAFWYVLALFGSWWSFAQ